MKKSTITLSNDEAIILQQISENGEDDVMGLAQSLRMSRQRVALLLTHLKRKGLISIQTSYGNWWVKTSVRGTRLVHYLWPETQSTVRAV